MRKVFALVLVLILALTTAAYADSTARTLDEIKDSGEIVIGVFSDKKPFGYVDENGEYQGYDVFFAKRLAEDLGVTLKLVSVDAPNRVEYLTSAKVDVILANFTVTPERAEAVDFALPYMKVALGVVSPDGAVITNVDELNGKTLIVVTEMPYQINKAAALEKILAVSQEKKSLFVGIGDIRDESDRQGMRAVIEVKKDGNPEKILQYLFKYTDLQCTFGVNMVAIAGGKPQQMGLRQIIQHYIRHQRAVVTRRTQNELEAAERREHILAGYMIAIDNLDRVIQLIRASKSPKEAKEGLMHEFGLTEIQAQAILDLRLQRLTNMELLALQKEYAAVLKLIAELKSILASDKKLIALIKKELLEIKGQLDGKRRTEIIAGDADIAVDAEDLSTAEDVTVAVCEGLKVRRCPTRLFNLSQIAEDKPQFIIETRSDKRIRLFTDQGAVLSLTADEIPETRATARAANLASLLPFEKNERILAAFPDEEAGDYLFYTRQGMVKRTAAAEYRLRVKRTAAITLREKDLVIGVEHLTGDTLLLVTRLGMSIRFTTESIPAMGRVSGGVKCMKVESGDAVCYAGQLPDEGELLVITDRGYGKRSFLFDYEVQGRNGKGLKTFDFKKNASNGNCIAAVFHVCEPFPFTIVQRHGTETTISTESVHIEPRAGKGSMLVAVVLDDDVVDVRKE